MATIKVKLYAGDAAVDGDWNLTGSDPVDCELSTDHSASSYGLPVVLRAGAVIDPLPAPHYLGTVRPHAATKEEVDMLRAAERAGWRIAMPGEEGC